MKLYTLIELADAKSKCVVCGEEFKEGDILQAFLMSPDDPKGSWTTPVKVDVEFQARHERNGNNIKRKHEGCCV